MSPNKRFCFPSYVKQIESNLMSVDEEDIYYRDEEGLYMIGTKAQDLVRADDTNDTGSTFDRNRYFTKEFIILARTAVAIGLMVFLWQALAKRVAEERTVDLTGEIEILDIEKRRAISISDVNKRIQGLEGLYQKYDLIHNFIRFFGMPNTREEQKELTRKKKFQMR